MSKIHGAVRPFLLYPTFHSFLSGIFASPTLIQTYPITQGILRYRTRRAFTKDSGRPMTTLVHASSLFPLDVQAYRRQPPGLHLQIRASTLQLCHYHRVLVFSGAFWISLSLRPSTWSSPTVIAEVILIQVFLIQVSLIQVSFIQVTLIQAMGTSLICCIYDNGTSPH